MAKDPWEEKAIERFRIYLSSSRLLAYGISDRDVVVNPETGENFDYQLQNEKGEKVAVELFRMVESGEELAEGQMWHQVTGFLRDILQKKGLKGYLVYTPPLSLKKSEMEAYAAKMAEVIEKGIEGNQTVPKFEYEGFKFHKIESLETIFLSYSKGVRSVDSRDTARKSFTDKLPKKNNQVNIADHERILLIVNWAFFVNSHAAIQALSSFDFQQLKNLDKIFFEEKEGVFSLVFDRSVIEAIKAHAQIKNPATLKLMISYLKSQLNDKSQQAFDFIKTVGTASGNLDWIDDNQTKENLIRFAEDLVEQNIDDAMWVVRMLQNDRNPNSTGANDVNDLTGEYNYHNRTMRNEDVNNITTVRGHLCWLMSRIISQNKPEYYTEIIEILQRYITEENLYIRIQATHPLAELVCRKKAVKNQDGSIFNWNASERTIIRELPLKMLRDNGAYPRVQEAVLHVFDKFRDLNEAEAEEVLQALIATDQDDVLHDLAALVVYFALFRKNDFPTDTPFNPEISIAILKQQIVKGKDAMKSSLVWHFWKLLEEKSIPYEDIREYIFLFWENGYNPSVASMLNLLYEQLTTVAPDDVKDLFEKMLKLLKGYLEENPDENHQTWIRGGEKTVALLVNEPNRLLEVVKNLKDIWMTSGIYIGDIASIFESYANVPTKDKDVVKSKLKDIYEEMKTVQPHIQSVDWSK